MSKKLYRKFYKIAVQYSLKVSQGHKRHGKTEELS